MMGTLALLPGDCMTSNLRYVLRDCEGRIIGNPKGYSKPGHANAVMARVGGSKAYAAAWSAYACRADKSRPTVWSMKLEAL